MNITMLRDSYFRWIQDTFDPNKHYKKLLIKLYTTPFTFTVGMDVNRYNDGLNLRSMFAQEARIDPEIVLEKFDTIECSILEMIAALAIRINYIMDDSSVEDKLLFWFWEMIRSLGLGKMTDEYIETFSHEAFATMGMVINGFLNRDYVHTKDGDGCLFPNITANPCYAQMEIWDQAMQWLRQFI